MLEKADKWLLRATVIIILVIVGINFVTSYSHIYLLGLNVGETGVDARLGPVGIDGMLLVLGFANVFAARMNRPSRILRATLGFAVASTVAANGAFGAHWGITGGLVSTWSPVALFIAVEAGLYMFKVAAEYIKERSQTDEGRARTEREEEARRRRNEASKAYKARQRQRAQRGPDPVAEAEQAVRNHNVDNGQPEHVMDAFATRR